jgi:signal transduction histidine kinase
MTEEQNQAPDLMTFLASAVHDMKNSVSVLSSHIEGLLAEHTAETLPGYEQTAKMLYEVKRVNCNLVQLLALYKVGEQHYPFDSREHSIHEFIQEVLMQNQSLFESMKIKASIDYDESLTWYFDEDLINGVVNHAINNAANYTRDEIRILVRKADKMLEIRVEDDGRGYPPFMLEQGTSLARGVSFATGSTGLGLYFSAVVAEMHKNRGRMGSVTLENGGSLGGGCFVLRLP